MTDSRKNILIFMHGYATQFIDICNRYTKLFPKEKYHVTVAYLIGEPNATVTQKTGADEVLFLNASPKTTRGLKISAIKKVGQLCRDHHYQIVICHRYKPTYIMLWVNLFCRIPVIFSVMHEMNSLRAIPRKLIILLLARKNLIFAGVSNAVRDNMRKDIWGIAPERVITLYNSIDIELNEQQYLSRADARKALNLADHSFVFGNIGRLAPNKDQKTLITAFAANKAQALNSKLIIIGDGAMEDELKQHAIKAGVADDVIFTGFLTDAFRYLRAFDVYVSSSIQEAFGLVLLEAMAAKVPVITTRANGMPEVVGDAGQLVEANNPPALAHAMQQAYQLPGPALQTWGDQGYQRAVQQFSIPSFRKLFWQLPQLKERNFA